MQQCESAHSSDGPLPAAIREVVTAAIEGGATVGEIVARVRARGGEGPGSAAPMDGLICLQRETDRFAEEWERTREPGAEGLSALIAIETLRTLALCTMAELGAREEPVPTEDLGRLALALYRIESADKLRIEREQAAADPAAAHAGAAARAASMTHAERVDTVRRAFEGHLFPGRTEPPPPASGWAAASPADSPVTLPEPTTDPPTADGAQDAGGALDVCDGRDSWDAHRARDAELRRREAEGRLWPTDPPFCPAAWTGPGRGGGFRIRRSRTRARLLIPRPRPFRRGRQAPVSCHAVRDRAVRCGRDRPQLSPGRASRLGRAPRGIPLIPLNPT